MAYGDNSWDIVNSANYKGGLSTRTAITGRSADELGMEDFFNLLVAQMTNQDMLNPTADTEYVAQMAQFTQLKGIETLQEYMLSSYATSYIGKTVAVAHVAANGDMTRTEGVVETISFYDGEPKVVVGGVSYPLYSVMEIKQPGSASDKDSATASDTVDNKGVTQPDAVAYIGRNVAVSYTDKDGREIKEEGVVESVRTNSDGLVQVEMYGEFHPAYAVNSVW